VIITDIQIPLGRLAQVVIQIFWMVAGLCGVCFLVLLAIHELLDLLGTFGP
jgi:hypothetical protein